MSEDSEITFEVSERNRVRRVAKRGVYDRASVFSVIDAAWVGHVGINDPGLNEQGLVIIPMLHARMNDCLVFHGATSSRLMRHLGSGANICVSFTLLDGLVLAKSLFHHSMNYRSAVVFGTGSLVQNPQEQIDALKAISDKVMPDRWEDARQPNAKEMKATAIVKLQIESASAKIRSGPPGDDPDDQKLSVWSGVVPFELTPQAPIADEYSTGISLPKYLGQA